jgi:hypothetical protein
MISTNLKQGELTSDTLTRADAEWDVDNGARHSVNAPIRVKLFRIRPVAGVVMYSTNIWDYQSTFGDLIFS